MSPEEIMKELAGETKEKMISEDRGPFGAAVVVDGKIVAKGFNSVMAENDPTAHAEIIAIRNAAKKLGISFPENAVLYTTSQSCPMCVAAALWAGIKKIYYGADCEFDEKAGLGDGHVYSYLRGNENPEVLSQEQTGSEYAQKMLNWFCLNKK